MEHSAKVQDVLGFSLKGMERYYPNNSYSKKGEKNLKNYACQTEKCIL